MKYPQAKLILKDGSEFTGFSFGFASPASGEVVFNTGMIGYPESLTDPSYKGQILVLTYPLIGNYGLPKKQMKNGLVQNFESEKIQVSGLVIADYAENYSHWSAKMSLGQWLRQEKVPGIFGVDTRELTIKLRSQGTMLGKLIVEAPTSLWSGNLLQRFVGAEIRRSGKWLYARQSKDRGIPRRRIKDDLNFYDPNKENLVAQVSCKKKKIYGQGKKKVLLIDLGTKHNIIRQLLSYKLKVIRVPYNYNFSEEKFAGIFLTNGPGDPMMCQETIKNLKPWLKKNIPIMGICLGHQIIALACGAKTYKLKYGHRSQNQPCLEVGTKRCYITSQNHGYAVREKTLPKDFQPWFRNLNDQTNEGLKHKSKPIFSVQFHPEANPGPMDTIGLFKRFISSL